MGRYKVGDKVRVREWDDMLKECGGNDHTIRCVCIFVDCMQPLCGKVFTVTDVRTDFSYRLDGEAFIWAFLDDMLYPAITYREYMKENYPDLVSGDFIAGVYCCPSDRGFRDYSCTSQCGDTYKKCVECWDQYMTEAEYKKYVLKEEDKEEMDYKVGDIVKVVKAERSEYTAWVPEMDEYIGRVGVVRWLKEDSCKIEGLGGWCFPYKDLEPATPKDILVPFCVVKTRSGNFGLFVGNNRVLFNSTFMDISTHSNTLESSYADGRDIVEIYAPATDVYDIHQLISKRGECIWKREEVVEITAEEATKKLSEQYPGQTVKIVM